MYKRFGNTRTNANASNCTRRETERETGYPLHLRVRAHKHTHTRLQVCVYVSLSVHAFVLLSITRAAMIRPPSKLGDCVVVRFLTVVLSTSLLAVIITPAKPPGKNFSRTFLGVAIPAAVVHSLSRSSEPAASTGPAPRAVLQPRQHVLRFGRVGIDERLHVVQDVAAEILAQLKPRTHVSTNDGHAWFLLK